MLNYRRCHHCEEQIPIFREYDTAYVNLVEKTFCSTDTQEYPCILYFMESNPNMSITGYKTNSPKEGIDIHGYCGDCHEVITLEEDYIVVVKKYSAENETKIIHDRCIDYFMTNDYHFGDALWELEGNNQ